MTRDLIRAQEQGTIAGTGLSGLKYRSSNWPNGRIGAHTWNAAGSYVTGAHSFKVGYQGAFHRDIDNLFTIISNSQRLQYRFNGGVPNLITMDAGPWTRQVRTEYEAAFVQDQWTHDRLTLQAALRFDHAWSYFPAQEIGPDRFIPTAITFERTPGVLGYNDISPRVGATYDLFGNGKTSLKVNIGKYLAPATNGAPGDADDAVVERSRRAGHQRRQHPAVRPAEPGVERRVRRMARPELRQAEAHDGRGSVDPQWLGSPAQRLAVRGLGAARGDTSCFRRSRLLPPLVAALRGRDRQYSDDAGQLQPVQPDRSVRSATPRRRRLRHWSVLRHQPHVRRRRTVQQRDQGRRRLRGLQPSL